MPPIEHLIIGLYRLAYYMLLTIPPPDTIEATEREKTMQLRAAIMMFLAAVEEKQNLPRTVKRRAERRAERGFN